MANRTMLACLSIGLPSFSQYQTIGPNSCGIGQSNCHAFENKWWVADNHFKTTDKFYAATPSVQRVATAYGMAMQQTRAGNNRCMNCHGTIITGKELEQIDIGVSCESCHGAGSGYKEPHTEGDPVQLNRPGYFKGLQFGMVENKNLNTRARTCTKCHNITDAKLIAAGHPSGEDFDYIRGMRKVSGHWKHAVEDAGQLRMAFAAVLSGQPAPMITTVTPKVTPVTPPPRKPDSAAARTIIKPPPLPPIPSAPRQVMAPPQFMKPKQPPQFPVIPDSLSDYEKAVIIKRHLDLLLKYYNEHRH